MESKRTTLQKMLVEDLSSRFFTELARRMPIIYKESISRSVKDDGVDEALKPYYFAQTRYTLVQSLFLTTGRECRHETHVIPCEQNGFPIPLVVIGRFHFTIHHGHNPEEQSVINSSLVRQQQSIINKELIQPKLFGATFDEEKLRATERIYTNIIFGCRAGSADFSNYGFMRIAIPYVKKGKSRDQLFFAENHDYTEILQMVIDKENQKREQKPMVNIAAPRIKISNLG
jgi:hypothetical protein